MEQQLARIHAKLQAKGLVLNAVATEAEVRAFEVRHHIELPAHYRLFSTRLGNGGPGPPHYGLEPLGKTASDMPLNESTVWSELRHVRNPFPFTKDWVWEEGGVSGEGTREDVGNGSVYIGNDGCGRYWHLIVTSPERGIPWTLSGEGIQPVCPKRSFLQWYEDWLEGHDSFYGFPEGGV